MSRPTAATRVFALLGDPVAHSRSPHIHNAAFSAAGVDAVYVALRCSSDDAAAALRALARAGGGGNVTVPHKGVAAAAVEVPSGEVLRTGACNTFWLEDGRICGDNTDVAAFRVAVKALTGPLAGARVLLLGAGGGARAVVAGLLDEGADRIVVRNRSRVRGEALMAAFATSRELTLAVDAESIAGEAFDLVVNATSVGIRPHDPLPIDLPSLGNIGALLDLVYMPEGTPILRIARERGIRAADGTEMLLEQAAAAFQRWWRRPAPVNAMRQALRGD